VINGQLSYSWHVVYPFVVRDFARPIKPGFLCPAAGLVAVNLYDIAMELFRDLAYRLEDIFGADRDARFVFQGEGKNSIGH
jgi:hypothetical protein